MGAPGMLGNHFDFPPLEGLWVSSFVVPLRVGFRAENAVGALVGFSASLSPNQQAYTKVGQDKGQRVAFILARGQYILVGGYLYPHLCYILTIIPLPTRNIRGIFQAEGHFIQLECTNCLPYPIHKRDATPKVPQTFGFKVTFGRFG